MSYLWHMLFMISVFSILALSLDLLVGHLGLLALSQSALYAIGAYVTSIVMQRFGAPFLLAALSGAVISAAVSLPMALAARRLRSDAVVLASLAVLLVLGDILKNWHTVTGGLEGIQDIPPMSFCGLEATSLWAQAVVAASVALLCWLLLWRLVNSSFGNFLRALRDDMHLALGLGILPLRYYLRAFAVSAFMAGLAGSLYACYATYISPSVFGPELSIMLLVMVLLGGAATRSGPVFGTLIIIGLIEGVRFAGMGSANIGAFYSIGMGMVLIAFGTIRSRGLVGGYEFR